MNEVIENVHDLEDNKDKIRRIKEKLNLEYDNLMELLPPNLSKDLKDESFIAGGSIYSIWNNKEPNDIDFFFRDKKYPMELRNYFSFVTKKPISIEKDCWTGTFCDKKVIITDNAVTFGNHQIITKYIGTPSEVVNSFDFKHNCFAFVNGEFTKFDDEKYLSSNELFFNDHRARDIGNAISRIGKFTRRGMTISKLEICKMLKILADNGFTDDDVKNINKFIENSKNKKISFSKDCSTDSDY